MILPKNNDLATVIPKELRIRPQWVVYKLAKRTGREKLDKIPFDPRNGDPASTVDSLTWATFEEAVKALKSGKWDGIGFVFSSGDPYSGVDLDDCRAPETGEIEPWAQEVIDRLDGYTEASPSGEGVHIIVRGKVTSGKRGSVEAYSSERFFTFTGEALR